MSLRRLYYVLLRVGTLLLLATLIAPWLKADAAESIEDVRWREIDSSLASLSARVTRLRDISDIERLQHSFGYYMDKQQWQSVRDLFSKDGVLEPGGRGRFVGQAHIHDYLRSSLSPEGPIPGLLREYQQLQGLITLHPDGNRAEGRWSGLVVSDEDWADLTYENDYIKEDGVWKLRYLRSVINMQAPLSGGWAAAVLPNTRPDQALPAPDLPPSAVYLSYPNYYNEPFHYPNPVTGRMAPAPDPAAGGNRFGQPH